MLVPAGTSEPVDILVTDEVMKTLDRRFVARAMS